MIQNANQSVMDPVVAALFELFLKEVILLCILLCSSSSWEWKKNQLYWNFIVQFNSDYIQIKSQW